jgi:hypothetical protein
MVAMRIHVAPMHVGGRKGNSKDREGEDSVRKDNVLGLGQEDDLWQIPVFVSDQSHSSRVPLQVTVCVLGQVQRTVGHSQLYSHQHRHLPSLLQRSD